MVDALAKGWYSELSTQMCPGQCLSLEYDEILEDVKSDFQHLVIFKSKTYGTVMALDGVLQLTERDEFSYQEMMAHIPLFSHPNPRKVLVIGGGDGGVLREVLKHESVEEAVLCEIDGKVVELCKKHLPTMACSFDSPKAKVVIGDGFQYLRDHVEEFDVIITDSSDPIGPASTLFEKEFYALMKKALRPDGILCTQSESIWLHLDLIASMQAFSRELFPVVTYAWCSVPTYPCGNIGFTICSKNPATNFLQPVRVPTEEQQEAMKLRYYTPDAHRAAFVLPRFAQKALSQ